MSFVSMTTTAGSVAPEQRTAGRERFRGMGALYINGQKVGEKELPRTVPFRISLAGEGFCVGYDGGLPVSRTYASPYKFTGTLHRLTIDVTGEPYRDPAVELRNAMAEQ